jgi:dihydrofolate reductase
VRKIILFMGVSVDGFIAGPNGDLGWHLVDEELLQHYNDLFRGLSAFLEGRVVYELMAEHWPTADRDPASTPQMLEFRKIWLDMPKVVYSRTLQHAEWNATVVHDVVAEEINHLKQQPGGDMLVGGADLGNEFLRQDLVDVVRLYVHPVIVGDGKPLFQRAEMRRKLRLVETHTFSSGVVLLHYAR